MSAAPGQTATQHCNSETKELACDTNRRESKWSRSKHLTSEILICKSTSDWHTDITLHWKTDTLKQKHIPSTATQRKSHKMNTCTGIMTMLKRTPRATLARMTASTKRQHRNAQNTLVYQRASHLGWCWMQWYKDRWDEVFDWPMPGCHKHKVAAKNRKTVQRILISTLTWSLLKPDGRNGWSMLGKRSHKPRNWSRSIEFMPWQWQGRTQWKTTMTTWLNYP